MIESSLLPLPYSQTTDQIVNAYKVVFLRRVLQAMSYLATQHIHGVRKDLERFRQDIKWRRFNCVIRDHSELKLASKRLG